MTAPLSNVPLTITAPGPQVAPFADFEQTRPGVTQTFDTSALEHIEFGVGQRGDYDFCVHDFKFLDAAGNEVNRDAGLGCFGRLARPPGSSLIGPVSPGGRQSSSDWRITSRSTEPIFSIRRYRRPRLMPRAAAVRFTFPRSARSAARTAPGSGSRAVVHRSFFAA